MSADKRSVHTDALETLGTIIGPEEKRDAIHLGVEPVVAGMPLEAGQKISLRSDGMAVSDEWNPTGIVDPFLDRLVQPGERFWLVVMPRKITSLRHVWEHPDFPPSADAGQTAIYTPRGEPEPVYSSREQVEAEAWIRNYVEELNKAEYHYYYKKEYGVGPLTYEELMEHADNHADDRTGWGSYLVKAGMLEGVSTPEEFWDNYEIVRGKKVPENNRGNFFSCSC